MGVLTVISIRVTAVRIIITSVRATMMMAEDPDSGVVAVVMMAICVLMAVGMTRGVMAIKVMATNRSDGGRGDAR